jgi:ABC-type Fe3+-hydroxamate transport system substrate-binding protein
MYGELFNVESKAVSLITRIENQREAFQNKLQNRGKLKVAYFIWKNPWMVVASNTFIDVMITEAGFQNVFKGDKRYPEIDLKNPKLKEADIIFLSSEPFPFKAVHILELRSQFPEKTIKIVDGEMFSWYGSRLEYAYDYFSMFFEL